MLSHAAGIGEPLDEAMARLIMVLKINSLSRGFSGIRLSVIQALAELVNKALRRGSRRKVRWGHPATWRRWRICR